MMRSYLVALAMSALVATDAAGQVQAAEFLSANQKRDIFCRNAARFLRLDPDPC